ncbi:polysaccharide biosynthesis protein, partial [Staphylococcus aureus]|uniref:polysaccharide biosynthesis protein n=1 Tax=Staphylococcus aureus TaxID=1280 RepID=UPI00210D06BF
MKNDKILLHLGGTGSFGNAVMKRFLDYNIKEIRIFSRDEKKQDDIRKKFNTSKLKFYIGDVQDDYKAGQIIGEWIGKQGYQ